MPAKYSPHSSPFSFWKLLLLLCSTLIALALLADFLWASSSSSSFHTSETILLPPASLKLQLGKKLYDKGKKGAIPLTNLSATYADLPAPQWKWEEMPPAPVPRLDGYAIQINNLLYVFSGYGTIDYVHTHVDIYDFIEDRWTGRIEAPREMANSHLGIAADGRYVYVVSGQHGPQCRKPTSLSFVLDTETKTWQRMPSLPVPRYAPATQLWRGRQLGII